jgi:hypothetical protein
MPNLHSILVKLMYDSLQHIIPMNCRFRGISVYNMTDKLWGVRIKLTNTVICRKNVLEYQNQAHYLIHGF